MAVVKSQLETQISAKVETEVQPIGELHGRRSLSFRGCARARAANLAIQPDPSQIAPYSATPC